MIPRLSNLVERRRLQKGGPCIGGADIPVWLPTPYSALLKAVRVEEYLRARQTRMSAPPRQKCLLPSKTGMSAPAGHECLLHQYFVIQAVANGTARKETERTARRASP